MSSGRRVDIKKILASADLRRELMIPTLQATQAREGIDTSREQAERAYHVVTETERPAFFDLQPFKGRRGEPERRELAFVQALKGHGVRVRFDVARRDFGAIDGSPLDYRSVGLVAHIFREATGLDPAQATVKQGLATSEDEHWVRLWWEVLRRDIDRAGRWAPFAKGGNFSRFYSDVVLVLFWANDGRALKDWVIEQEGSETKRIYSQDWYFKSGLTWPRRTQRGFNVRVLPSGCIFADKGPAIFPRREDDAFFILGISNSAPAEALLRGLMSFGSWEVGVIKRLPIPQTTSVQRERVSSLAKAIHDAKAAWDEGNEISTHFRVPWLLWTDLAEATIPIRLDRLEAKEKGDEARIQGLYAELNDDAYRLYGIPGKSRELLEESMGPRAPEVIWPQMEGQSADQKRMEHVWRLLSFAVKRVLEGDDDGIVPFGAVNAEARLIDRIRLELAELFAGRDLNQVEVEIVNELRRGAKGYRKCASLEEWLDSAFFEFHCSLYNGRPIYWHLASAQGATPFAFGVLVHYHRFDKNRMAKLRSTYLRDSIEEFRREAGLADKLGRADDRLEWQTKMEETLTFDRKLQLVQEGNHEGPVGEVSDYRILTPWKKAEERPKGWDPDLDDGVKVNIGPLEKAGVLRIGKVT